jgi:hypothetical protein
VNVWDEQLPEDTCPTIDDGQKTIGSISDHIADAIGELDQLELDSEGLIESAVSFLDGIGDQLKYVRSVLDGIRGANARLRVAAVSRGEECERLDAECDRLREERDDARDELEEVES